METVDWYRLCKESDIWPTPDRLLSGGSDGPTIKRWTEHEGTVRVENIQDDRGGRWKLAQQAMGAIFTSE